MDGSFSSENVIWNDEDESEVVLDRLAIKEKFERLDAEAQRTAISSRKKVSQTTIQFYHTLTSVTRQPLPHFVMP